MPTPRLHIGNKRTSTWSLRPWLVLRKSGLAFEECLQLLDMDDTSQRLGALSPASTVPVLELETIRIWDSLAIAEWAAEQTPSLWPKDPIRRAAARSITASMHSGFSALRNELPMDLQRAPAAIDMSVQCWRDIETIQALWASVKTGDGPFLFGEWSIADAFFTPVATRFERYAVPVSEEAQAYCAALLSDRDYLDWLADAAQEPYPTNLDE